MYNRDDDNEIQTIQFLLTHASKYPVLKKPKERELIAIAQGMDKEAAHQAKVTLLNHNFKIIIKNAKAFTGQGVPLEDLIQEGCDGFLHSIDLFKLELGFKLSTYATNWIKQKVRRAIENKSKMAKIPSNKLAEICQLKKAYKNFVEEKNRNPSSKELADILGITREKAEQLGRLTHDYISLDTKSEEEEEALPLINYLMDEKPIPDFTVEGSIDKEYINNLLTCLSKDDQDFVKLRFGFLDDKERTAKEMSILLNISLKEAKDREKFILTRLRDSSDVSDINAEIRCNIVILDYSKSRVEEVVSFLKKPTRLSSIQILRLLGNLPSRILFDISQHLAEEYAMNLENMEVQVVIEPIRGLG